MAFTTQRRQVHTPHFPYLFPLLRVPAIDLIPLQTPDLQSKYDVRESKLDRCTMRDAQRRRVSPQGNRSCVPWHPSLYPPMRQRLLLSPRRRTCERGIWSSKDLTGSSPCSPFDAKAIGFLSCYPVVSIATRSIGSAVAGTSLPRRSGNCAVGGPYLWVGMHGCTGEAGGCGGGCVRGS
jgi:hypothetical protein